MKHIILAVTTILTLIVAEPTVTVLNGTYSGRYLAEFEQDLFLGIPYAQNAGGQNRFRAPQALNEKWSGVRPATNYSNACPTPERRAASAM